MKLGFVSIYSFRPHVKYFVYLAHILGEAGHKLSFLTCDASVPNCYARALKGNSKLRECSTCIVGGLRSFPVRNVQHIRSGKRAGLDKNTLRTITSSSSYTLNRTETVQDLVEDDVINTQQSLYESVDIVYENTLQWIDKNRLDGVICFNGRMELPRAATYACEQTGIPFLTFERTWLGHGLYLIPNNNCLALKEQNKINRAYRNVPLTLAQAQYMAKLASERFLQKNVLEWRVYNASPEATNWPINTAKDRVLILPSSKNEFEGHPDWVSGWNDYTVAFDELFERLDVGYDQCVLRCHPNWAENIGINTGTKSERHYVSWAEKNGIFFIPSAAKANTYDLIQQADIIVVNGSTTAVEAGVCGKKVICMGHAAYEEAGFTISIRSSEDWGCLEDLERHEAERVVRRTLRYMYSQARRFPQYVDYVRANSTTQYSYYQGADPERVIQMLQKGQVEADDTSVGTDEREESGIVNALLTGQWQSLAEWQDQKTQLTPLNIQRRVGLRWVDAVRAKLPKGDR